jgi:D-glycero-D-manno-heptose 1,7-bisphosphate phosphatase
MVTEDKNQFGVFLDRDGTLIKSLIIAGKPIAISRIEDFEYIPNVIESTKKLREIGTSLFMVTNQPDVGRGKTSLHTALEINKRIINDLVIDDYLMSISEINQSEFPRPKPFPDMILYLMNKHRLLPGNCFMVGDRWKDIEAGNEASVHTIYINSPYRENHPINASFEVSSFAAAVEVIIDRIRHIPMSIEVSYED